MRRWLRTWPALPGLLAAQCFAVPERGCEDASGLFVAYHVCMPPAGFDLSVDKLVVDLQPANFDGEDLDNDLAALAYIGEEDKPETWDASVLVVQMRQDLGSPTTRQLTVPIGTASVAPIYLGSNRQSIAYVYDATDGTGAGTLGVIRNMDGEFAAAPVTGAIKNPLQGCRLPTTVTTLADSPTLLVTCVRDDSVLTTPLFQQNDLGGVDVPGFLKNPDMGLFYAGLNFDEVAGVHGTVLFDVNADGVLDGATISLPTKGDGATAINKRDDKVVIARLPKMQDGEIMVTQVKIGAGPIDDLYAVDLDGEDPVELVARHQDKSQLTILQQTKAGTSAYAVVAEIAVPQPLDVTAGDFSGDGRVDLAVVHVETDRSVISALIHDPDTDAFAYSRAAMGGIGEGELATAIEALHVDGDDATDLAVAVVVPGLSTEIRVYLNRAAGPR